MFPNPHHYSPHNITETRHEPEVLSEILIDDDPERAQKQGASRQLAVTLLLSISAHLLIFAAATWSASKASRNSLIDESQQLVHSVQIRILDSTPRSRQDAAAPPEIAAETTLPEVSASDIPEIAESTTAQPDIPATEPITPVIAAEPSAPEPATDQAPAATAEVPRLVMPSSQDLRAMIQSRAATDRQRSLEILCEQTQKRLLMMDCGPAEEALDIAIAERNDIVEYFSQTTLPNRADIRDPTSAGGRVKGILDIIDAQLGTTQTKKRIMGIP